MTHSNFFKIGFLFVWLIASCAYVLADLLGEGTSLEKAFSFSSLALFMAFALTLALRMSFKIPRPGVTFFLLIFLLVWMVGMSVIQNSIIEWVPTTFRYFVYLMIFIVSYQLTLKEELDGSYIERMMWLAIIVGSFFGLIELARGDLHFVNGSYRMGGNFNNHHLGYSLFLFVPLLYNFLSGAFRKSPVLFALWFLGMFCFIGSHSRALQVLFIFTIFLIPIILSRRYELKFGFVILGIVGISLLYVVITSTELLPRLQQLVLNREIDSSTAFRIFVLEQSIKGLDSFKLLFGIGAGGFNEFFYNKTGMDGVAVHNDYLLVAVEGGLICLFAYVLFQILVAINLIRASYSNKELTKFISPALGLFISIEIGAFLLNAHYYFQSEVLVMLVMGHAFGGIRLTMQKPAKHVQCK